MERSVLIAGGNKDVLLPVERGVLNSLWKVNVLLPVKKKMALLPVERALLNCLRKERCALSCGVYLIACGEKKYSVEERDNSCL